MKLIYLSPVQWSSYAQRPHFMVKYFLGCCGKEVLWINPYPGRLPRIADLRRPKGLHKQGTERDHRVIVADFDALPLEPFPGGYHFNRVFLGSELLQKIANFISLDNCVLGIGKPSALAVDLLQRFAFMLSFYDAMDDFPVFHGGLSRLAMANRERKISQVVDEIFVSSTSLADKFNGQHPSIKLVHNACDPHVLPSYVAKQRSQRVIGYLGSIGEWFDWSVVLEIAVQCPSCEIRLIGPHLVPPPRRLPPNVNTLPACRHDMAGVYLSDFDMGLIPFKKTLLTRGVDPIKYYEYRAMGLPILTTSFGEMQLRRGEPGVFFIDNGDSLKAIVQSAFNYFPQQEEIMGWRNDNSWTSRFDNAGIFDDLSQPV